VARTRPRLCAENVGQKRLRGRIAVQDVVIWHYELEQPVEQIAEDYNLTLGDVYAALAYYHDHKKEIDKSMKEGEKLVEQMKKKIPSKWYRLRPSKNTPASNH